MGVKANLRTMAVDDKDLEEANDLSVAPIVGPDDPRRFTDSGIEIEPLYTRGRLPDDLDERLGEPGESPVHPRRAPRDVPQAAVDDAPVRGLRVGEGVQRALPLPARARRDRPEMAFDLPTQLGLDSDDPRCLGEVGRTGVAIDSIDDMRTAFDGIPLDEVSTSMTINAPAAVLLLLYQLVGEEQGVDPAKLRGTVQNDILKEYIARGNFIYPPEPSMRLMTDLFAYCAEHIPKWNTVSISGYHFREKGCSRYRRSPSRSPTAWPTCRPRSTPASRWTTSPPAWRSSSTATTTSSRRSRSSAPPGSCGRSTCATASGPRTRSRRRSASTPRPAA